jgi:hypothetical protein
MPDYLDEKIVAQRQAREKEKHKKLEDGMYVKNTLIQFRRIPLLNETISIVLPDSFIDLPKDMADLKYPYINRPKIIKTSLDTRVNYCFSLFANKKLYPDQTLPVAEQVRTLAKRANPSLQFVDVEILENAHFSTSWYDFKSFAMDGQLYNIVFITSVYEMLMHGLFNCPYDEREEWRPIAFQMIEAIGEYTKETKI